MNSPWVDVAHAAHVECAHGDGRAVEWWGDRSEHGNVPHQRFQHAAVAVDGQLLLVGGTDGKLFYDDIHVFDPVTFVWTAFTPSAGNEVRDGGRARHTVVVMHRTLYMFGGICKHGYAGNKVHALHLDTGLMPGAHANTFEWREVPLGEHDRGGGAPPSRFDHAATVFQDRMYVFGGEEKNHKLSNLFYSFDPGTRVWRRELSAIHPTGVQPPPPGKQYKMIASKNHIYIFSHNLSVIHKVSFSTDGRASAWDLISTRGRIPGVKPHLSVPELKQYSMTSFENNEGVHVIVFAGITAAPTCLVNESHMLIIPNTSANTDRMFVLPEWRQLPKRGRTFPCPRVGQTLTYVCYPGAGGEATHRERVYMFGGYDSDTFLNDFFFLDLQNPIAVREVDLPVSVLEATTGISMSKISRSTASKGRICTPRNFTMTAAKGLSDQQCVQLVIIGGGRTLAGGWYNDDQGTENIELNATQANQIVRLIERTRDPIGGTLNWAVHEEPMAYTEQVKELLDEGISSLVGHTANYFSKIHGIVVYGGGNQKGQALRNDRCLWVLMLGSEVQAAPDDSPGEAANPILHLTEQKNRAMLRWEHIPLKSAPEDAQRTGHASEKFGDYLYVFGGYSRGMYSAKVIRINIEGIDATSEELKWRADVGAEWEYCYPWKQSCEILKANMMTPRAGHSVVGFEQDLYIFGGAANGLLCNNSIHVFNAESFAWTGISPVGSTPCRRFAHATAKVEGAKRYMIVTGGIGLAHASSKPTERFLSDIWTFDIDTFTWTETILLDEFQTSRYGHAAVSIGDHEIFIFGGDSDGDPGTLHATSIHMDPPFGSHQKDLI